MVDVDIVGSVRGVPEQHEVLSGEFVGSVDSLHIPIGPEEPIVENGQCENVRDL